MSYFVGVDLHSNNSNIGILDNKDKRIFDKRVPNDLKLILKELQPYKKKIKGIVVESTYNWYWLIDGLMESKYKVHLANPTAMEQYSGLKHTNDKSDSFWLAHMLRVGLLPEGYIYPKSTRPIRDLLRKRLMLVRHRTSHLLSLGNMLTRNTGFNYTGNRTKALNCNDIDDIFKEEHLRMAAKSDLSIIDALSENCSEIEKEVVNQVKLLYPYENLLTVHGIGKILGITIMLETGDIRSICCGKENSKKSEIKY